MHLNQWRDCLAFDLGRPVYLRRRFMTCQKVNCKVEPNTMTVQEQGVELYPFLHSAKHDFTKQFGDFIISAVVVAYAPYEFFHPPLLESPPSAPGTLNTSRGCH